jgi:hypothetical protein
MLSFALSQPENEFDHAGLRTLCHGLLQVDDIGIMSMSLGGIYFIFLFLGTFLHFHHQVVLSKLKHSEFASANNVEDFGAGYICEFLNGSRTVLRLSLSSKHPN